MEHEPKSNPLPTIESLNEPQIVSLGIFAELSKNEILESLRSKGSEDSETMETLTKWLDKQQANAEQDPTNRIYILLELARADFYLAIGDTEEALNCLDATCLQAQQEGHFDLLNIAEMKMSAIYKVSHMIETK